MEKLEFTLISAREAVDFILPFLGGSTPIHVWQADQLIKSFVEDRKLTPFFREVTRHEVVTEFHDGKEELSDLVQQETWTVMDFDKSITIDTEDPNLQSIIMPDAQRYNEENVSICYMWTNGQKEHKYLFRSRRYKKEIDGCLRIFENFSSEIFVPREQVIWWTGGSGGNPPIEEKNLPASLFRNRKPSVWDWEGALVHLIRIADTDGLPQGRGIGERGKQARLEEEMKKWFSDRNGGSSPVDSEIRRRAQRIIRALDGRE